MFQSRSPESPSSNNNKIKAYFESSSYLNQQQQISIFLKNFPMIKLNQISSINNLISVLIKQNSVLAQKCQEDVSLLKQSFHKHQNLLKNIKELKAQNNKLSKQSEIRVKLEKEVLQLKSQIQQQKENTLKLSNNNKNRQKQIQIEKISKQKIKSLSKNLQQFTNIFNHMINQQYKKCQSQVKNLDLIGLKKSLQNEIDTINNNNQNSQNSHSQQESINNKLISFFDKDYLQKTFKEIRYKTKSLKNITIATFQFCNRLKQILKVVPASIIIQELGQQVDGFTELLQGIENTYNNITNKKQRPLNNNNSINMMSNSKSKSVKTGIKSNNLNINNSIKKSPKMIREKSRQKQEFLQPIQFKQKQFKFFDNMLSKLDQNYRNSQAKEQISLQLQNLKQALSNSKQYYQNFLQSLRKQYQTQKTTREDQLVAKQQMISYYQKELQKINKEIQISHQENKQLIQQIKIKNIQLNQAKETILKLQKNISALQSDLSQTQNLRQKGKQQIWKINQMQVQQRDNMIQQLKSLRKKQRQEFQQDIQKYKKKYKDCQIQNQNFLKDKKSLEKNVEIYQSSIQKMEEEYKAIKTKFQFQGKNIQNLKTQNLRKNKQIDQYKQNLKQHQHEKSLQVSYIQQLQNKIKALQGKIQTLSQKKQQQKTTKKELASLKNSFNAQKKYATNMQQMAAQLKQQNQRLKGMILQMKKQLQDVYIRLNNLREIQQQRQRLMFQAQNSQRARNQILNDYQQIKFSVMQIQAENKALQLQVKHYKNALTRIQGISEYINPV